MECEGISTIYCDTRRFRRYLRLLSFSISERCRGHLSRGTKVAPALQSIVGSHVDNGVILVTAEWEKMAMGQQFEIVGDCWVLEARRTDVSVIRTPCIGGRDGF